MRKILLLALILMSFGVNAQTPKTVSNPMTGHYYKFYSFVEIDSALIFAPRDTFWTPKQKGTMILDSFTNNFFQYNGVRWSAFGSGGGTSSDTTLRGKTIPALTVGVLKYTGTIWTFDSNTYFKYYQWLTDSVRIDSLLGTKRKIADTTGNGGFTTTRYQRYLDSILYRLAFQPIENQRLSSGNNVMFNTLTLPVQGTSPAAPTAGVTIVYFDSLNRFSWVKSDGYRRTWRFPYAGSEILTAESKAAYTIADSTDVVTSGVIATNNAGYYLNAYKIFTRLNTDSIFEGTTNLFYTALRVQSVINGDTVSLLATKYFVSQQTISGVKLGGNLFNLTNGYGITSLSYNGSAALSIALDSSVIVSKAFLTARAYISLTSLSVNTSPTSGAASYNNATGVFTIPNLTGTFWSLNGNTAVPRTDGLFTTDTSRIYLGTKGVLNEFVDSLNRLVWGDTARTTFPTTTTFDFVGQMKIGANFSAGVYMNNANVAIATKGIIDASGGIDVSRPDQGASGVTGLTSSGSGNVNIAVGGTTQTAWSAVGNLGSGNYMMTTHQSAPSSAQSLIAGTINTTSSVEVITALAQNNLSSYNMYNATFSFDGSASNFTTQQITMYRAANPTYVHNIAAFRAFATVGAAGSTQYGFYDSLQQNYFGGATLMGSLGTINGSALLDMESTTQGFLMPQMTGTQILAITSPKNGLVVFNITTGFPNWYNSTSAVWNESMVATTGTHTAGQIGMYNSTTNTYTVGLPVVTGGGIRTGNGTDTIYMSSTPTLFTETTSNTITGVTSENVLTGTGIGTDTIPANNATPGKLYTLTFAGVNTMPAITAGTFVVKVYYGSTVIATGTTSGTGLAGLTNSSFGGVVRFTCQTSGATGTAVIDGSFNYSTGNNLAKNSLDLNNGGAQLTGVDFTAKKRFYVTVTPSLTTISIKTNTYLLTSQN